MNEDRKYAAWLYWLKRAGFHMKVWKEDIVLCPISWRVYYDEGYRVHDAIKEDLKNV